MSGKQRMPLCLWKWFISSLYKATGCLFLYLHQSHYDTHPSLTLWTRVNGLIQTTGQLVREISAPISLSVNEQENHIRRKIIYECLWWALFFFWGGGGCHQKLIRLIKTVVWCRNLLETCGLLECLGILQQKLVQILMLAGLRFPTVGFSLICWWF